MFDRAYRDVDALVVAGALREALVSEQPRSRIAFARLVLAARRTRESARKWSPYEAAALASLERAFAPEIGRLSTPDSARDTTLVARGSAPRRANLDLTVAESPQRRIPTSFVNPLRDNIDADLNPLLQRNEGRRLANGATLSAEAIWEWQPATSLAIQLRPRVWAAYGRGPDAVPGATFQEAYLRLVRHNAALDLGRTHVALGFGPEAGPLLGYNARGLDGIRLSMDSPARMPWVLRWIGPVLVSGVLGDLGRNSDTPGSNLLVFSGTARPLSFFEVQVAVLNHSGGENSPPATWMERLRDALLIKKYDIEISDKVGMFAARIHVPRVRGQFYVQMFTTDDHNWFRKNAYEAALQEQAAWTVGLAANGRGNDGQYDLWLEARRAGVRAHTHHQFLSGLTIDRRTIGDAMGPVSMGLLGGLRHRSPRGELTLQLAAEQYGGADRYEESIFSNIVVDNPDEIRWRLQADWNPDAVAGRWSPLVRAGVEHVSRFDYRPETRLNGMLQVGLQYGR